MPITIIGGGLAGVEAAWHIARAGYRAILYEMRPQKTTPAHQTGYLAELVCSNSFRSAEITTAVGLLKEEMVKLGSLVMEAALKTQVPAGKALAVDRLRFASYITEKISSHPLIEIKRQEITTIPPEGITIIATGPLTSQPLAEGLKRLTSQKYLHFYDAIAPIVYAESINMEVAFFASRYSQGNDYLNCPLNQEEYERFYQALLEAEKVPLKDFERPQYFEGCLPIEVMAERGKDTLRFGPMKPVGLIDPRTGKQPYAVVQLRKENQEGSLYNMVGFQTKLKWPEQKRVFRLIPGLEKAEFARYGSIHRNTFLDAPRVLDKYLRLKACPRLFIAGQLSGIEGYVESAATGILAGINAVRQAKGLPLACPPPTTALGALINHLTNTATPNFQPSNINWGLFAPLSSKKKIPKAYKRELYVARARQDLDKWLRDLTEK